MTHQQTTLQSDNESQLARLCAEISEKLRAGESVDLEEYAADWPQHLDELRQLLPAMQALMKLPDEILDGDRVGLENALAQPLGDFRIIRKIGQGGMGIVYEAEQLSLRRSVALKVLPFAAVLEPQRLQRFKIESLAAAQLSHPGIVNIYGVGCDRGVHYYAMQFVQGQTLAELLVTTLTPTVTVAPGCTLGQGLSTFSMGKAQGARSHYRRVAEIGVQIANALHYAHQSGVIHRDIKPSNLLINAEGQAWVTDFGLAQIELDASLTRTGSLLGTPRYMSPEQAQGDRSLVDHRCDIYSLGITLYELATLIPARTGASPADVLRQIRDEEPIPPRQHDPRLPIELETIILKAIAPEAAVRYQTAEEFAADLRRFLDDIPIRARRATIIDKWNKWCRRHQRFVRWATVGGVVSIVCGAFAVNLFLDERRRADYESSLRLQQESAARESAEMIRRHRYVADVASAGHAWDLSQVSQTQDYLARCLPGPGETDLRGFEWHYLSQQVARLPQPFARHQGPAYLACESPEGTLLATAGIDGLRIWDAEMGTPLQHLREHSNEINHVVFSPNGKLLATGSDDHTAKLWNTQDWSVVHTFDLPSPASSVEFSPVGQWLLITERPELPLSCPPVGRNQITLYDTANWQLVREWAPHSRRIHMATFSADSQRIATASDDGLALVFDVASGEQVSQARQLSHFSGVHFSPDGQRLATCSGDGLASVWKIQPGAAVRELAFRGHHDVLQTTQFLSQGTQLLTSARDGTARLWQLPDSAAAQPRQIALLRHPHSLWSATLSHDEARVYTAGAAGEITRWNIADVLASNGTTERTLQNASRQCWFFLPASDRFLSCWSGMELHDGSPAAPTVRLFDDDNVSAVALTPDGRRFVSVNDAGDVQMHELESRRQVFHKSGLEVFGHSNDDRDVTIAFAQQGDQVLVVARSYSTNQAQAVCLDAESGEILPWPVPEREKVWRVLSSPNGEWLMTDEHGWLQIHSLTGRPAPALEPCAVMSWSFSSDGSTLAALEVGGRIQVWRTSDWRLINTFITPRDSAAVIALSANGSTLAAAGFSIRLWNVATGRELLELTQALPCRCFAAQFSPTDRTLIALFEADKGGSYWWRLALDD